MMDQIKSLKITTLAEYLVQVGGLGQKGLSFLLELVDASYEARKVIFNTCVNKETLLHDLKLLKANLSEVYCVVINHVHRDHPTATVEVVEAAGDTKVYGYPHTFLP